MANFLILAVAAIFASAAATSYRRNYDYSYSQPSRYEASSGEYMSGENGKVTYTYGQPTKSYRSYEPVVHKVRYSERPSYTSTYYSKPAKKKSTYVSYEEPESYKPVVRYTSAPKVRYYAEPVVKKVRYSKPAVKYVTKEYEAPEPRYEEVIYKPRPRYVKPKVQYYEEPESTYVYKKKPKTYSVVYGSSSQKYEKEEEEYERPSYSKYEEDYSKIEYEDVAPSHKEASKEEKEMVEEDVGEAEVEAEASGGEGGSGDESEGKSGKSYSSSIVYGAKTYKSNKSYDGY